MKKLFLTSGLVLCMACPAMATGLADDATGTNQCVTDVLGTSTDGANVQLKALWTNNYDTMTLNDNIGTDTSSGGLSGTTHSGVFLVGGDGVYTRTGSGDADYAFTKVAGDGTGTALTTRPSGITVNFSFDANTSSLSNGTHTVTGMPSTTGVQRQFKGYYAYGTTLDDANDNTNRYITNDGKLTTAGNTAAEDYNNSQPWIALYTLVHPTGADNDSSANPATTNHPSLTGYTFKGWSTNEDAENGMTDADYNALLIGENTTLYAIWEAHTATLSYNCGSLPSGANVNSSITTGTLPDNQTLTYDETYNLASAGTDGSTICALTGWHFTTWDCTGGETLADASGAQAAWTHDTGLTCTPHWVQNTINLHWDVNQATSSTANGANTCAYDGNVGLPTPNPSRTGYTFNGWEVVQYNGNGGVNTGNAN